MYSLACRDLGTDCPFVAKKETKEEVMTIMKDHAMADHQMKEEDFNPEFMSKADMAMKTE